MSFSDVLKIRVSQLSDGVHEYRFLANAAEMVLEEGFESGISVNARLEKGNRQLYLTVEVSAVAHFQCDRCLETFTRTLESGYHLFYVYDEVDAAKYQDDEVRIIPSDQVTIDLTEDVRQELLLSIPLKLLCNDDCRGLCPSCGTNWNIATCACERQADDPRWQGLRNLFHDR